MIHESYWDVRVCTCVWVTERRGRQQPYGSFWCSWCFTYRLNHDPLSAPSHRHPHIHTHFSPLLFLSCTLHPLHPSSLTYRLSPPLPPPLLVRHTHKNAQDMLTLGYGARVLGQGVALGWMDTLDWANKACMGLLADRLAGQLDAKRTGWEDRWTGGQGGAVTPLHRVMHLPEVR